MGQIINAYASYIKGFADNPEYEKVFKLPAPIVEQLDDGCKVGYAGKAVGTFLLENGQVACSRKEGVWEYSFLFANEADWKKYSRPMSITNYFDN